MMNKIIIKQIKSCFLFLPVLFIYSRPHKSEKKTLLFWKNKKRTHYINIF